MLAKRNIWLWAGRLQKDKRRKQREKVRRERVGIEERERKNMFWNEKFSEEEGGGHFFLSGGKRIFSEEILKERV